MAVPGKSVFARLTCLWLFSVPCLLGPAARLEAQSPASPNGLRPLGATPAAQRAAPARRTAGTSGGETIQLTPVLSSATRMANITAPGPGLQQYSVYYLDLSSFTDGGTLDIEIEIPATSPTDGSFDLFPGNARIPTTGRPTGTLTGRYDVHKGTTTRLDYKFQTGQVFALGLEGNWSSPKGATGIVTFTASVNASPSAKAAELDVVPIIYGPSITETIGTSGVNAVGVCIYLGARKKSPGSAQAKYNWVQRVVASDKVNDSSCVYPHDERGYFGETEHYFIDNCGPGQDAQPSLSYAPASDFYRNNNAVAFEASRNPSWVDPKDSKPFDYLFMDIPSRSTSQIDNSSDATTPESGSGLLGRLLNRVTNAGVIRWDAVLTPVRRGDSCAVQDLVVVRNGQKLSRPYCKLDPQPEIRYGFNLSRVRVPMAKNPSGTYYKMMLQPLRIDGRVIVPGRSYIFHFAEDADGKPVSEILNDTGIQRYPMTVTSVGQQGQTEQICTHDFVKSQSSDMTTHLPEEPAKFKRPFTPWLE